MIKKGKLLSVAISGLCLATAVSSFKGNTPVDAASNKYLEDFIIIDATNEADAKTKAESLEGYTLLEDKLWSETLGMDAKYVACKYTSDSKKALTDIRAMNMLGGFSSEAYEKAMESKKTETEAVINRLYSSVLALKNNYATSNAARTTTGADGICYAYDLLSYYTYDDLIHQDTQQPYTIAELLTSNEFNETTLKQHLTTIFMQANSKYVSGIEMALMHAASSTSDALNLATLNDDEIDYNDYTGSQYSSYEEPAALMAAGVEQIQQLLGPAFYSPVKKSMFSNQDDYNNAVEVFLANSSDEERANYFNSYYSLIAFTSYEYHYEDGEPAKDFAEFFMGLNTEDDDFDNRIFYPIIEGMNAAQLGCLPYAGFQTMLGASFTKLNSDEKNNNAGNPYTYAGMDAHLKRTVESDAKVSVFEGIDRSVYTAKGVALTNDALRQNNSKNDFYWFAEDGGEGYRTAQLTKTIFAYAGLSCLASSVIAGTLYFYLDASVLATIHMGSPEALEWGLMALSRTLIKEATIAQSQGALDIILIGMEMEASVAKTIGYLVSILYKVIVTLAVVAVLALITCIVAFIIYRIYAHFERTPVNYIDIPEIMVDEETIDGKAVYSNYYAVTDEEGNPQSTTYYRENHETQWVALYKTRDASRGNPILADGLRITGYKNGDNEANYTSVRKFGETSKYNVQTFVDEGDESLYLGYKTEIPSNAGSIFSNTIGLAVLVGTLGLGFGATGGIFSYKYALKRKVK